MTNNSESNSDSDSAEHSDGDIAETSAFNLSSPKNEFW